MRETYRVIRKLVAVVLLGTMFSCTTWHPTTVKDIQAGKEDREQHLRLYFPDGTVELREHWVLDYPLITGEVLHTTGTVKGKIQPPLGKNSKYTVESFDLERVQRAEIMKLSTGQTVAAAVGIPLGIIAIAALIAAATKSSCPFVYVDDGGSQQLIGEGYPGAIFRSIQREDLLALPIKGEGSAKVRLVNWAPETQYTDRLELALVDHAPEQRALATADARIVLVGASQEPRAAKDLEGVNCLAAVRAKDDEAWGTNLHRVSALRDAPVREGIEAAFQAPDGRPVLELRMKNTKWMEMVFGRVSAMMGDSFATYLKQGNEAPASTILAWRRREGVDLRVEALRGRRWETIGYLPATGAVAMRDLAVPLPVDWPSGGMVQVRVSGGTGFWSIDAIALSALVDEQPLVRRVPARQAVDMNGFDQLATLASVDGRYNELVNYGDWLEANFFLPAIPNGATRSVFMAANGYYNAHPPVRSDPALDMLSRITSEDGGLARYGLSLYRDLTPQLHMASVAALAPAR